MRLMPCVWRRTGQDAQSLPEDSEEGAEHGAEAAASTRADMGSSVAGSRHTDGPGGKPRCAP